MDQPRSDVRPTPRTLLRAAVGIALTCTCCVVGKAHAQTGGISPSSWTRLATPTSTGDQRIEAFLPHSVNPDIVLVGTERMGIFRTTDGGVSWVQTTSSAEMANLHVLRLVAHPVEPDTVYALVGSHTTWRQAPLRLLRSTVAGASWIDQGAVPIVACWPSTCGPYYKPSLDVGMDGTLYASLPNASQGYGEYEAEPVRSHDNGRTWEPLATHTWGPLAVSRTTPGLLLQGGPDGTRRSSDWGATWSQPTTVPCVLEPTAPGLDTCEIRSVAFAPGSTALAYSVRHRVDCVEVVSNQGCVRNEREVTVLRSLDGGISWHERSRASCLANTSSPHWSEYRSWSQLPQPEWAAGEELRVSPFSVDTVTVLGSTGALCFFSQDGGLSGSEQPGRSPIHFGPGPTGSPRIFRTFGDAAGPWKTERRVLQATSATTPTSGWTTLSSLIEGDEEWSCFVRLNDGTLFVGGERGAFAQRTAQVGWERVDDAVSSCWFSYATQSIYFQLTTKTTRRWSISGLTTIDATDQTFLTGSHSGGLDVIVAAADTEVRRGAIVDGQVLNWECVLFACPSALHFGAAAVSARSPNRWLILSTGGPIPPVVYENELGTAPPAQMRAAWSGFHIDSAAAGRFRPRVRFDTPQSLFDPEARYAFVSNVNTARAVPLLQGEQGTYVGYEIATGLDPVDLVRHPSLPTEAGYIATHSGVYASEVRFGEFQSWNRVSDFRTAVSELVFSGDTLYASTDGKGIWYATPVVSATQLVSHNVSYGVAGSPETIVVTTTLAPTSAYIRL